MNSMNSGQTSWVAVDGGSWWMRDSTYSEPNGDYSANCWLWVYNQDSNNIMFNDANCGYCTSNYLCSTNDKDPAYETYEKSTYETLSYNPRCTWDSSYRSFTLTNQNDDLACKAQCEADASCTSIAYGTSDNLNKQGY
jgi:hypothetical protein